MPEEINNQEPAQHRSRLWIGLALGLVLLVGLIAPGCKNSANSNTANSNTTQGSGKVVKNSSGMEFAYAPAGSFQMKIIGSEKIRDTDD